MSEKRNYRMVRSTQITFSVERFVHVGLDPSVGWVAVGYEIWPNPLTKLTRTLDEWQDYAFSSFGKAVEFVEGLVSDGKLA